MKITCPACSASYTVPEDKIPSATKAKATCKKCGGKIEIVPRDGEAESKELEVEKGEAVKLTEKTPDKTTEPATTHEMKKTSVLLVIFLTFITFGIYFPIWFLKRRQSFNKLNSEKKLGSGVFTFITIFYIFYVLISFISGFLQGYSGQPNPTIMVIVSIASLINLVCGIILWVKCFTVRRMLIEHFQQPVNWVATLFFTIYYLQYKINRL